VPQGRAKRLVAPYDKLDRHLKGVLKLSGHEGFAAAARLAVDAGLLTPEEKSICEVAARIRNIVVHDSSSSGRLVVPTTEMLSRVERVIEAVMRPPLAISAFRREVETVQSNSPLAGVFRTIAQRDYSQFPVYRSGRFFGLLTENGITRWLSRHVVGRGSVVSVGTTEVHEVLESEAENHGAAEFVPKDEAVCAVAQRFRRNPLLEAVLITSNGLKEEDLLGIATRWDIAALPASERGNAGK